MSDYENYKGKLIPTNLTMEEYVGEYDKEEWQSCEDCFNDYYYEKAILINDMVYECEFEILSPYADVLDSNMNHDGTISFRLKYYNGGMSFNEAISKALE